MVLFGLDSLLSRMCQRGLVSKKWKATEILSGLFERIIVIPDPEIGKPQVCLESTSSIVQTTPAFE
jgi:hypothetical protein